MRNIPLVLVAAAGGLFFACGTGTETPTGSTAMNNSAVVTAANPSAAGQDTSGVQASSEGAAHHANATLVAVNGSGVSGHVDVTQLPHGGSNINVVASGLVPGTSYLSLYYENHTCELEPYSADDVIGTYTANPSGGGHAQGKLGDDLDEINSISVRLASDFSLVACANVHP